MANSLFIPNHSFIVAPRIPASFSSKPIARPQPLLGFSATPITTMQSSTSSRASSFKSHLAPRQLCRMLRGAPLNPRLLRNGEEEFMIPMTGAANSTMGQFNACLLNGNTPQMCTYNSFGNNNMVPRLKRVSTELNVGSPQSDQLSPDSQSSPHSFGMELDGDRYCNSTKVGRISFQLFGKTIHMTEPIQGIDAVGCTGEGGNIGYNESELLNNQLDLSYTKLLERIDVRVSAVEACTL